MQRTDDLHVRQMNLDDLKLVLTWAEQEGWNPVQQIADAFYAADPQGYFILEKNNFPIASLSNIKYNNGLTVLGLYIVNPLHRGQGYGKYLWDKVTQELASYRYTELEATQEQVDNYRAVGFEVHATTSRYVMKARELSQIVVQPPKHIRFTDNIQTETVSQYEQTILPQKREAFLDQWLKLPTSQPFAAYNQSGICGYGQISKAAEGYRISPLYAEDLDTAFHICVRLGTYVEDDMPIYIDIPDDNKQGKDLVKLLNMKKTFETVRMYYKAKVPNILVHKIFGKASLEIG